MSSRHNRYKIGDRHRVAAARSRVIAEVADPAAIEIDMRAGQQLEGLRATKRWAARDGRWEYFPWRNDLRRTIAVSTGLNDASALSTKEFCESGNGKSARRLHDRIARDCFHASIRPRSGHS